MKIYGCILKHLKYNLRNYFHDELSTAISQSTIWQSQLLANPCALIGSFSAGISQFGPFSWKRSKPYIFVLGQRNLQPKQTNNMKTPLTLRRSPSSEFNLNMFLLATNKTYKIISLFLTYRNENSYSDSSQLHVSANSQLL